MIRKPRRNKKASSSSSSVSGSSHVLKKAKTVKEIAKLAGCVEGVSECTIAGHRRLRKKTKVQWLSDELK